MGSNPTPAAFLGGAAGAEADRLAGLSVRVPAQLSTVLAGLAFLLAGALGFVPGATTRFGTLGLAGDDSDARLLGTFQVSVLHNLVHVALGVALLLGARSRAAAALTGGGIASLALWFAGVVGALDWLPVNAADNWLHLLLGLGLLALASSSVPRESRPRSQARSPQASPRRD